jgi:hypothetical protein
MEPFPLLLYYSIRLTFYCWKFAHHLFLCFFSFKIEHLLQRFGVARFEFYCGQKRDIVITPPPLKKICAYFARERVRLSVRDGMLQCIWSSCRRSRQQAAHTLLLSPAGIEAPQPRSDETAGVLTAAA